MLSYNIKDQPRTSHAPWTNGLVDDMNRSLTEYLRCIINGKDKIKQNGQQMLNSFL